MWADALQGAMIGVVVVAVALPLMILMRKAPACGGCGAVLPKFRMPRTFGQAMWGGHTCPGCGAELDARGRVKSS